MGAHDIRLRPTLASDIPILFTHQLDDVARQMAAFTTKDAPPLDAFSAKWSRILNDGSIVARTILQGDAIVGHAAVFPLQGELHVTYWIQRNAWGRGIATRALRLILAEVPARPLYASAAADNAGSIRVLERCGFRRSGTARAFAPARECDVDEAFFVLHDREFLQSRGDRSP